MQVRQEPPQTPRHEDVCLESWNMDEITKKNEKSDENRYFFSAYLHIFYRLSDRIHQVRLWDVKSFKLMVFKYMEISYNDHIELMVCDDYQPYSNVYNLQDQLHGKVVNWWLLSNVNPGLINPKRLFNWGDTIKNIGWHDYWRSTPPIHKPWFSPIRGWHYWICLKSLGPRLGKVFIN